jgi:hypothetical protein
MQIYNDKGKLIKRPKPEDYAENFANCFETLFDKTPEPPENMTERLEIGFELLSITP